MSKAPKTFIPKKTRRSQPYPPITTTRTMASPISPSGNRSAGPWSAQDDEQLKQARQRGMNWAPIARDFFPTKSANACRKRHERLMDKISTSEDWAAPKLEEMAKLYLDLREQMWSLVASRLGENWKTVESKCMEKGIKTLQSAGRRRDKTSNTGDNSGNEDTFDDSGLGPDADRQQQQDPNSAASDVGHSRSSHRTYSNASSYGPPTLLPLAPSPQPPHLQYHPQPPPLQQSPYQLPSTLIQQQHYQQGPKLPSISHVLATTGPPMRNIVSTTTM